jgi:hypothetical protein
VANRLKLNSNPLRELSFDGVRMISMHEACLSVITKSGTYRYQFERECDLRTAFSDWCESATTGQLSDDSDGLNIVKLRH